MPQPSLQRQKLWTWAASRSKTSQVERVANPSFETRYRMSTRILVIDDDQSMCELIQESLQRSGWQVEWRMRGDEGLELFRGRDFDVVITDLNLDNMSGIDLCRNLTENRPDTPVIV